MEDVRGKDDHLAILESHFAGLPCKRRTQTRTHPRRSVASPWERLLYQTN